MVKDIRNILILSIVTEVTSIFLRVVVMRDSGSDFGKEISISWNGRP
jgi:hypothetical protein